MPHARRACSGKREFAAAAAPLFVLELASAAGQNADVDRGARASALANAVCHLSARPPANAISSGSQARPARMLFQAHDGR